MKINTETSMMMIMTKTPAVTPPAITPPALVAWISVDVARIKDIECIYSAYLRFNYPRKY